MVKFEGNWINPAAVMAIIPEPVGSRVILSGGFAISSELSADQAKEAIEQAARAS